MTGLLCSFIAVNKSRLNSHCFPEIFKDPLFVTTEDDMYLASVIWVHYDILKCLRVFKSSSLKHFKFTLPTNVFTPDMCIFNDYQSNK